MLQRYKSTVNTFLQINFTKNMNRIVMDFLSSCFRIEKLIVEVNMQTFGIILVICALFPLQWYYMLMLGLGFVFASPHFDHPAVEKTWTKEELLDKLKNVVGEKFLKKLRINGDELVVYENEESGELVEETLFERVTIDFLDGNDDDEKKKVE